MGSRTRRGLIPGGEIVEVQVAGRGGVPAERLGGGPQRHRGRRVGVRVRHRVPVRVDPPHGSTLNFVAGQVIPNAAVAKVGLNGRVCVFSNVALHLVVDVNGYYPAGSSYVPVSPMRLLNFAGLPTIDGQFSGIGMRPAGVITELQVAGRGTVPTNAAAVVLNVTVTDTLAGGFATVFPCGFPLPTSSNLNFWQGATIANAVITKVGVGGRVCLYSNVPLHAVVDVNGYFPAGTSFTSISPVRLADTRAGAPTSRPGGVPGPTLLAPSYLEVVGRGGIPTDATAVVMNVTVTETTRRIRDGVSLPEHRCRRARTSTTDRGDGAQRRGRQGRVGRQRVLLHRAPVCI